MTTPEFSYQYNPDGDYWVDTQTGQIVPNEQVIQEMHDHQNATYEALDALTLALFLGSITLAEWEIAVAQELKDAHLAQAMFGAGGKANLSSDDIARINETLANEFGFLDTFANDIANGDVSEKASLARVKQYGNASQQSYWTGLLAIGATTAIVDTNPLYTVPGAGATRCRGNCKCTLVVRPNGLIDWKLNPAEHCPDCLGLAADSPYTSKPF